jgi:glycosyltransferase involved in cell wall biosynthesis
MLAYLMNQYPKTSHSFIRREIGELERQGWQVQRIALRVGHESLPDAADRDECARTRYILAGPAGDHARRAPVRALQAAGRLVAATVLQLARHPRRFGRALLLALRTSRRAPRPWPYHLAYLAEACVVARLLQARHLHAHFGTNAAAVAMLAATLAGISYSFTVHGPEEFDDAAGLHLRDKLQHAAFAVAVSNYGGSQLCRHVPHALWHKIHIIRCGLDVAYGDAAPLAPLPAPTVVCVGRLCVDKGQLQLLEAAARVLAAGISCEIVLAGDGELRAQLQALGTRLGLQDHMRITGWLSGAQVKQMLLNARAMVLPSLAEGLPVALMEAMALGRPVLSTYIAGIPELVQPGRNGWLVPAGDADALAHALAQVLAMPLAELARMGHHGKQDVARLHSLEREVAMLGQHFQQAIATGRRA